FDGAVLAHHLEGAHAQVGGGDPGENRSRECAVLTLDVLAGGHRRERPGGRNAQGVHRFTHQVLPQHRSQYRLAVATPGERRAPRPLEGDVAAAAVNVGDLTQQNRAAVTEHRVELAELVP